MTLTRKIKETRKWLYYSTHNNRRDDLKKIKQKSCFLREEKQNYVWNFEKNILRRQWASNLHFTVNICSQKGFSCSTVPSSPNWKVQSFDQMKQTYLKSERTTKFENHISKMRKWQMIHLFVFENGTSDK
jgi:hypothetical protein